MALRRTTNAFAGLFGATNSFWLMSGKWFYAARWIRDSGAVTNYAWNNHGQTNETALKAAEYFYFVTSSVHSVIWDFGYPNTHHRPRGLEHLLSLKGLFQTFPVTEFYQQLIFQRANPIKSKYVEFSASTLDKQGVGFYFSARRNTSGPHYIDVQYSFDGTPGMMISSPITTFRSRIHGI